MSKYVDKNNDSLAFYAPTYSIACLPIVQILLWLRVPAVYGFAYTNVFLVCLLLLVVYFDSKIENKKKILLILSLSINPIMFYFSWQSAEVFIYTFLDYQSWHG